MLFIKTNHIETIGMWKGIKRIDMKRLIGTNNNTIKLISPWLFGRAFLITHTLYFYECVQKNLHHPTKIMPK